MIPKSPGIPAGAPSVSSVARELALGVLRRLASSLEAELLALLCARIAGQEARRTQRGTRIRMRADERSGDPVADGSGLTGDAPAGDEHAGRVAALGLGHAEGKEQRALGGGTAEVLARWLAVDDDAAVAGQQADPRDGGLAPPGPVDVVRAHVRSFLVTARPWSAAVPGADDPRRDTPSSS